MMANTGLAQLAATEETIHRVYHLGDDVLENMRAARDKRDLTNQQFLALAIEKQLPVLVDGLKKLGITASEFEARAARLPMCDSLLAELKAAAEEVGLPASLLLSLCIKNQAATPKAPTRRAARKSPKTRKTANVKARQARKTGKKGGK